MPVVSKTAPTAVSVQQQLTPRMRAPPGGINFRFGTTSSGAGRQRWDGLVCRSWLIVFNNEIRMPCNRATDQTDTAAYRAYRVIEFIMICN